MGKLTAVRNGRQNKPPRIILYGVEGIGKAQPLDAKILTPKGWKTMGDMKVGSRIIGADGKAHNVIGVFPQGVKEVFKVKFEDGSCTECCDEHLWKTTAAYERDHHQEGCIRNLSTIRQTLKYGTRPNHAIQRVKPVEFDPSGDLPCSPWLLGIYLAEGVCDSSVVITNPEKDIQERIKAEIDDQDQATVFENGCESIRITRKQRNNTRGVFSQCLADLGLCGKRSQDKFIPKQFLLSSIENRIELMRGIADGDGYVCNDGTAIEISTVSPQMAEDIMFLARSLGCCASTKKLDGKYKKDGVVHECKEYNRITITNFQHFTPVSSKKHLEKMIHNPSYTFTHTIREVVSVGEKECQCIMVDAIDELYVTDDFIVTHNTTFAANANNPIFIPTEDGLGQIDCASFPIATSYADVIESLTELGQNEHDYKTVVIDSADWLEPMIFKAVCDEYGVKSIHQAAGGYNRGYDKAVDKWADICDALNWLRDTKNMTAIIIAHSKIKAFNDPENPAFDRYMLRLDAKGCDYLMEWADAVLFATRKMIVAKDESGRAKAQAVGANGGERIVRTTASPACAAKNRYNLPDELPLDWNALQEAINNNNNQTAKE